MKQEQITFFRESNDMDVLKTLQRVLQSEVKNHTKSPRTADEYVKVAKKLLNGDFTDETIPSKARYLQISAVLTYMKDYGLIAETESYGLHLRALKKRYKGAKSQNQRVKDIEEKVLTDAQFKTLLEAIPQTHDGRELKRACEISRYSGLRVSEVLSLTPEMIVVKPKAIYLSVVGKRNKPRTVWVKPEYCHIFDDFTCFTISRNYVACTIRRIARSLGLTGFSFHGLRHTFATEQSANGVPVEMIADMLGHEDPKTTMLYRHVKRECPQILLDKWERERTQEHP